MKLRNRIQILCILFFLNAYSQKYNDYTKQDKNASFLSGYKILSTPKDDINIGAEWIDGQGPSNQGIGKENLFIVKSLSNFELQKNRDFNFKVLGNIIDLLGLNIQHNQSNYIDFSIDDAEVVRVNNFSSINYTSGQAYILEGIKVKSFSYTSTAKKIDSIAVNTDKLNLKANAKITFAKDGNKKISFDGLNLYIAYKLVTFGEPNIKTVGKAIYKYKENRRTATEKIIKTKDNYITYETRDIKAVYTNGEIKALYRSQFSGFKIGEEYEGILYSNSDFNKTYSKSDIEKMVSISNYSDCPLKLVIKCYNEIINSKPKCLYANLNCNNNGSESYSYTLGNKIVGNKFQINELEISIYQYENRENVPFPLNESGISPNIQYRQITIPIKNKIDTTTAGW